MFCFVFWRAHYICISSYPWACTHLLLLVYLHVCVYCITDYLSASQMTGLLIRNDAETIGDSWEKSQKPKVQNGNASIKIFIKTTPFTLSSVTNDSLLLVGLKFLPTDTHIHTLPASPWLRIKEQQSVKKEVQQKSVGPNINLKSMCQTVKCPKVGK